MLSSLLTLAVSVISLFYTDTTHHPEYLNYTNVSYVWMPYIGSSFSVGMDGMGFLLTFLTAFTYPLIFASTRKREYSNTNVYYGLMLLTQAGLMGVFVAMDALVFYFFWELALIPMYFLCSRWGGEFKDKGNFQIFHLHVCQLFVYAYRHYLYLSAYCSHFCFIGTFVLFKIFL